MNSLLDYNLHSIQEIENTNCQIKQLTGLDVFELKELFASGWKLAPPDCGNKENNLIGDWIQYQMKCK